MSRTCQAAKTVLGIAGPFFRQAQGWRLAFIPAGKHADHPVRRQGYAIDDQEHVKGVRCMAVPIFDHKNRITAAISLSTLTAIVNNRDFERYAVPLNISSSEISASIGHRS